MCVGGGGGGRLSLSLSLSFEVKVKGKLLLVGLEGVKNGFLLRAGYVFGLHEEEEGIRVSFGVGLGGGGMVFQLRKCQR